ncbi:MAG: hypothetical protein AAF721_29145 [Myxococcota bacterium]
MVVVLAVGACGATDGTGTPWMSNGASAEEGGQDTGGDEADDLEDDGTGVVLTAADDDHGGGPGDDTEGDGPGEEGPDEDDGPGEEGDGHADGDGDDGGPPPADCPENCYCEPIDPYADVADLQAAFSGGNWADSMIGVLERRWPAGAALFVDRQANDGYFGNFTDTSSWGGLMDSMMTEAHEGTHGWDYDDAFGQSYFGYWMREDLKFQPPKIEGFPRSEIYGMVEGNATDLYKDLYLSGTQGTYAWYELLDEGNAYINGMGGIGVVGEFLPWGTSGRDGAVAFLYYAELYLKRARTNYPELYDQLKNSEYKEMLQVQWLRTHFLMIYAADLHPDLGINDDAIEQLLYADENQVEMEMFIDHELDASNCLP